MDANSSALPSTTQLIGRAHACRAVIVIGDPICVSRGREKSCMPSGGGIRTYLVNWGQRWRPLLSDPLRSAFRDYSRRVRGGAQVNHPIPIGEGVGGSLLSETLVWLQLGIWWFGHGLKGGPPWTRSPAQTVAKQPIGLRDHSVVSGWL